MRVPSPLKLVNLREQQVEVSSEVCRRLGVESVWARPGLDAEAAVLLHELQKERCGHSWRTALQGFHSENPQEIVTHIEQVSAQNRPTQLFTYWGIGPEGEAPLAIAALSSHVSHDFLHPGFPVVARCLIRRCYRGMGLYPFLLAHRLARCQSMWGEALMGIHIGASDPAVISSLAQPASSEMAFVCIGQEWLQVGDEAFWVPDYFAATPRFLEKVQEEYQDSNPLVRGFLKKFMAFLREGAHLGNWASLLESAEVLQTRHGTDWWLEKRETRSFFDLMDQIGVARE